jgi:hypothetical protein
MSFIKFASTPVSSTDPAAVVMTPSDNPTNSLRTTKTKNSSSGYLSRFMEGRTGTTPNTTPLKKEVAVPESSQLEEDENSLKEPRKKMRTIPVVDKDDDDDDDDDDAAFLPDDFKLDTTVTVDGRRRTARASERQHPLSLQVPPPSKSPSRNGTPTYTWVKWTTHRRCRRNRQGRNGRKSWERSRPM